MIYQGESKKRKRVFSWIKIWKLKVMYKNIYIPHSPFPILPIAGKTLLGGPAAYRWSCLQMVVWHRKSLLVSNSNSYSSTPTPSTTMRSHNNRSTSISIQCHCTCSYSIMHSKNAYTAYVILGSTYSVGEWCRLWKIFRSQCRMVEPKVLFPVI